MNEPLVLTGVFELLDKIEEEDIANRMDRLEEKVSDVCGLLLDVLLVFLSFLEIGS